MKKVLIAVALIVGMASNAQEKMEGRRNARENQLTKEQRQELHLKKMTLDLDLSTAQQKEIQVVLNEQSNKRETALANRKEKQAANAKKPTADERFAIKNQMLDDQIAMKARMKKILSNEQFKKWETMKEKKNDRMNHRLAMHKQRKGGNSNTNK
ncbi:hypothetical protein [Flavobacterium turcicum]|uniref:LTXXQ motif family protein n=1 Tax=Flavobacterium turcicum TaxID=2764718 RepID=A0ABR7JDP6_9FLAO|nr:hypothetical protein [Flavobacterium turcicum]MBC5862564.1 hypothetical protein [Flavobacterium turcicum]NHL01295.1 hypothetical protein [Flavobacterium turcicum]